MAETYVRTQIVWSVEAGQSGEGHGDSSSLIGLQLVPAPATKRGIVQPDVVL